MPGGVFVFFKGQSLAKPQKYIFLPQRVEFRRLDPKKRQGLVDLRQPYFPNDIRGHLLEQSGFGILDPTPILDRGQIVFLLS